MVSGRPWGRFLCTERRRERHRSPSGRLVARQSAPRAFFSLRFPGGARDLAGAPEPAVRVVIDGELGMCVRQIWEASERRCRAKQGSQFFTTWAPLCLARRPSGPDECTMADLSWPWLFRHRHRRKIDGTDRILARHCGKRGQGVDWTKTIAPSGPKLPAPFLAILSCFGLAVSRHGHVPHLLDEHRRHEHQPVDRGGQPLHLNTPPETETKRQKNLSVPDPFRRAPGRGRLSSTWSSDSMAPEGSLVTVVLVRARCTVRTLAISHSQPLPQKSRARRRSAATPRKRPSG